MDDATQAPAAPNPTLEALRRENQALKHANGRLFPFGLIKILWHARKLDRARILVLGLIPEYRKKGIDVILYHDLFEYGMTKGIYTGEFSWVLEDNLPIVKPIESISKTAVASGYGPIFGGSPVMIKRL